MLSRDQLRRAFVMTPGQQLVLLGIAVIVMVVLAGTGQLKDGRARTTSVAERETYSVTIGNKLFIPALTLPVVTVLVVVLARTSASTWP
jgi:uncharacterized membrane protein